MHFKSISEITSINRSAVVGQSFMFRKHLERKQLKSRECLCTLGAGTEKEESRCFLLRPKAEDKEVSSHSVSSLQGIKMKAKDRKYSLKPNLKENENSSNLNSENFMANLESIRYRLNILQNKQKNPVNFTYQSQTKLQSLGEISLKEADYSDKKEKKTWETENSTVASLIFTSNRAKPGTKVSIMYLKKRLITQNSADTDLPLEESEQKTCNTRAFSSASLDSRQKIFKFNPNFPSFKFIDPKNQDQENRATDRDFLKLNQLCFKKAQSVGESECSSEHVSEVENSFSSRDQEAFQGNWNTSLKDIFQKRQQKMNPQFY